MYQRAVYGEPAVRHNKRTGNYEREQSIRGDRYVEFREPQRQPVGHGLCRRAHGKYDRKSQYSSYHL